VWVQLRLLREKMPHVQNASSGFALRITGIWDAAPGLTDTDTDIPDGYYRKRPRPAAGSRPGVKEQYFF